MLPRNRNGWIILVVAVAIPLLSLAIRLNGQAPSVPRLKPNQESARGTESNPADEISRMVRDKTGAKRVDTIVVGNVAVIGMDRGAPPARSGAAGGPHASDTYMLKRDIQADIMGRYPFLVRIYSTDDPNVTAKISTLARDFRHQVPLDARIDVVSQVVKAVSRPGAGGVGPTVR